MNWKKQKVRKEYLLNKFSENFYCTWITKCITEENWETVNNSFQTGDSVFINSRGKGGFLTAKIVIPKFLQFYPQ